MSSNVLDPGDTAVTSRDPTRLLLELNPQDRRKRRRKPADHRGGKSFSSSVVANEVYPGRDYCSLKKKRVGEKVQECKEESGLQLFET